MTPADFNNVVETTVDSIRRLLVLKGGEYAIDGDRLSNFKRGAESIGITELQVALIYASKHWEAIGTFIRDEAQGKTRERLELIEGRFDDLINYCILMKAIIQENQNGH